jgi:VIT1/CCC1 family predicted Fe2+/Mn2+ transporter
MQNDEDVILQIQKNEITEARVYASLARRAKGKNKEILTNVMEDEKRHYEMWKEVSGKDVGPNSWKIFYYYVLSVIFGVTYTIKLMETGEGKATTSYKNLSEKYDQAKSIYVDEEKHEETLYNLVQEEKLSYLGAMVLGLNDALVEITGTLAGLTFALGVSRTVGVSGLITGVAAALSMAASEYMSQVADKRANPMKATIYTFMAYIVVVILLVLPYFLFGSAITAFFITIGVGVLVVVYYASLSSLINDKTFRGTFLQMLMVVWGVSLVSFGIGTLAKLLGVTVAG